MCCKRTFSSGMSSILEMAMRVSNTDWLWVCTTKTPSLPKVAMPAEVPMDACM